MSLPSRLTVVEMLAALDRVNPDARPELLRRGLRGAWERGYDHGWFDCAIRATGTNTTRAVSPYTPGDKP